MKNFYIIILFILFSNLIAAQQLATQTWDKTNEETQLGKQTLKKQRSSSFANYGKPLSTNNWIVNGMQVCSKDLNESITNIEIFDVQGKKVANSNHANGNCISLPNGCSGIYFIRWKDEKGWQSEKVILK